MTQVANHKELTLGTSLRVGLERQVETCREWTLLNNRIIINVWIEYDYVLHASRTHTNTKPSSTTMRPGEKLKNEGRYESN